MQLLLLERQLTTVTPLEFATTLVESSYSHLRQHALSQVFPSNCHLGVAVNSLALETAEHKFLLSGCADSSIKLWDVTPTIVSTTKDPDTHDYDNPRHPYQLLHTVPRKSAHAFGVSDVKWWPYDSGMFVSASFDHTVKVWDTNEMAPVHEFDITNRVYSVDIRGHAPNTRTASALVAVALDQPFVQLLDLRLATSAHTLPGHKGKTLAVKWHPTDPNLVASGGFDGEAKIWDIRRSNACLCRLDMLKTNPNVLDPDNLKKLTVKAHLGPVNGLVWDEAGTTLFTAGNDNKVRVWNLAAAHGPPTNMLINFGPLTRNKFPQTIPLCVNPKGETELQYLLFPSDSGDIFIYRTVDGKLVSRLTRKGTRNSGRTTAIANAGPLTATYYCGTIDGEILVWGP